MGYLPEDGGSQFLKLPTFTANWTIIENSKEDILLKKLMEHNVLKNQISYNCLKTEIDNYMKSVNSTIPKITNNNIFNQVSAQTYQSIYNNQQMMSMFKAYQTFTSPITSLEDKRLQQPTPCIKINPIPANVLEKKEEITCLPVFQENKKQDKLNHYQNILDNLDLNIISGSINNGEWNESMPKKRLNVFRSIVKSS